MGLWKDKIRKDWCYSFVYQKKSYAGRGYATRREAAAAREDRRKEIKSAPIQIETGMAFSEVINRYLDHSERAFAVKTHKYKKYVYKSFYKFLKVDLPVKEITTQMVKDYLMTRPSNNNFNVHKKDLSALFTYAQNILEVIEKHPVMKIQDLPHTTKVKTPPSEEAVIKLMLATDPETDEQDLLIVLLHTLARIDEVLRLTWSDVNFEKRILVKKTKKTKDHSYKDVPVKINDTLYATLWKMWEARTQDVWVFYNDKTATRYYHRPKFMKGLCKRAKIVPYFTFHTLRHMMASMMDDNPKITTSTIQKILGHTEERTTQIYLHKSESLQEEAMGSISDKFKLEEPDNGKKNHTG